MLVCRSEFGVGLLEWGFLMICWIDSFWVGEGVEWEIQGVLWNRNGVYL